MADKVDLDAHTGAYLNRGECPLLAQKPTLAERPLLTQSGHCYLWRAKSDGHGVGRPANDGPSAKGGLGTSLVRALAHQLDAQVEIVNSPNGMRVSVTHATFVSRTAA